jgi:lipoyl(octanoyl) transferase
VFFFDIIGRVNKIPDKTGIADATIQIIDCGIKHYCEILLMQQDLVEKRKQNLIPDTVIIVEHLPVITLGARKTNNKLLVSKDFLNQKQIELVETRRGGGTTAHNPGQLVFYPILDLHRLGLGINEYIRKVESIGAELLNLLGVESTTRKGLPGLWIQNRKIASVGVRVSKFITSHGMAINIQNDLEVFNFIRPCGLDDVTMTSVLRETGQTHSMIEVKEYLSQILQRRFAQNK